MTATLFANAPFPAMRARHVEVVAEFVETVAQRDVLAALGCDVFQGYLYSPALPAAACVEYLLANGAGESLKQAAKGPLPRQAAGPQPGRAGRRFGGARR